MGIDDDNGAGSLAGPNDIPMSAIEDALHKRIAELEAALAEIHATARRVTHHHEWYLDGVRQTPGEYVIMRVGDAPVMQEPPF